MPRFSIITPLYNKERYFSETADSVLRQKHGDWEWLIVNDGSTDDSSRIARDLAAEDVRIRLFTQANSGPCTARNRGIGEAQGEWVLFLDADDLLEPDCLSGWQEAIKQESGTGLHAGCWHETDSDAQAIIETRCPPGLGESDCNAVLRDAAIAFAPWHPSAAVVEREHLVEVCGWPEEMDRMVTEDTVFWWRLIARSRAVLHGHCGVRYRRGTPGCRDQFQNPEKWSEGLFHALDSNIDEWEGLGKGLTSGQVSSLVRVYENLGMEARRAGALTIAEEAFRRADHILSIGTWRSPAARARRALGTQNFTKLRQILAMVTPIA